MSAAASAWPLLGGLFQPALECISRWSGDRERPARVGVVPRDPEGALWLHASSVGELGAVPSFLAAASASGLGAASRLTCHTRTGLDHARARLRLSSELAPLDAPFAVRRRIRITRPAGLVIFETELWPCMVTEAAGAGVPVSWVNARVSPERFPAYRRLRSLLAPALARVSAVAAQTGGDADRFLELGAPAARIQVCGNLKHDREDPSPMSRPEAGLALDGPVAVFGSLREGEEKPVLEALRRLRLASPEWIAVLAPRHPEENERVAQALRSGGVPFARRTGPPGQARTLLLDTLGELARFYTMADVAFVGGSLLRLGGHDLLEPARAGAPVLFGPHTSNGPAESNELLRTGGGAMVRDADELAGAILRWGSDPAERSKAARAAREVALGSRGAAARAVAWLIRWGALAETPGRGGNAGS